MGFRKERKRTRGEIACAECRRLKARCDKRIPCSTCIKRGCDVLCPNNTMPPGEGSRFVAVAEGYLRRKITRLEDRMRLLEDALAVIQSSGSCNPYPSLYGDWSSEEMEGTPEIDQDPAMDTQLINHGLADALGSLFLSGEGPPSDPAPSESESLLVQAKAFVTESSSTVNHTKEIDFSYLPQEISVFYQAFPFTPSGIPTRPVQDMIESYLPPFPRATALCETFLQSMSWVFNIVSRRHILGELVPMVYRHAGGQTPTQPKSYSPHDIALLFIVFSIGALVDPSLPSYNVEGQHYHILSRAALCLQPVFEKRSVVTIKVLNLMSIYIGMCGIESKLEHSSYLLNLAAQAALQIGFHKDPSAWGIAGREAYEWRTYFWNLLGGTLWQSLISGRPPVILPSLANCHIPTQEEEDMYQYGDVPLGLGVWSFSFIIECLAPVVEATQGARLADYDTVLALDGKIREFLVPHASSSRQIMGPMQTYARSQLREITLLFLHRSFFVQALEDFPWDPLRSPLRQSFLTAYQSATGVLSATRKQFAHQPAVCARVWRLWSFAFLAAVTIATVAIKRLSVNLEPEPFEQLDLACALFCEAAHISARAQKALPILLRLRQVAAESQPETLQSGKAINPATPDRDTRDVRGAFSDSSGHLVHHPTSSMLRHGVPQASASSSKHMQTVLVPVVQRAPAGITESVAGRSVDTVGMPEPDFYHAASSPTDLGSHGLPSSFFATHPPECDVMLEDRWTPFMHDRT